MRNSPAKPRSRSIRSPLIPGLLLLLGIAGCRDDQSAVEPTAPVVNRAADAGILVDVSVVTEDPELTLGSIPRQKLVVKVYQRDQA